MEREILRVAQPEVFADYCGMKGVEIKSHRKNWLEITSPNPRSLRIDYNNRVGLSALKLLEVTTDDQVSVYFDEFMELQERVDLIHRNRNKVAPDKFYYVSLYRKTNPVRLPALQYVRLSVLEYGDFNDAEQDTAPKHWREVTRIGTGNTWLDIMEIAEISYKVK